MNKRSIMMTANRKIRQNRTDIVSNHDNAHCFVHMHSTTKSDECPHTDAAYNTLTCYSHVLHYMVDDSHYTLTESDDHGNREVSDEIHTPSGSS